MDKKQAQAIIKDTFENLFDKERFIYFVKNLLNSFDDTKAFPKPMRGQFIREAFRDSIAEFDRLGRFNDRNGKKTDILTVRLQREKAIENARTKQRNFIAGYLKGDYGSSIGKDAALVAFYHENSPDWRFSLVTLEPEIETEDQTIKIKDKLTPARRCSFLVGINEKSHTAQRQLVDILADDEKGPTLTQLE